MPEVSSCAVMSLPGCLVTCPAFAGGDAVEAITHAFVETHSCIQRQHAQKVRLRLQREASSSWCQNTGRGSSAPRSFKCVT